MVFAEPNEILHALFLPHSAPFWAKNLRMRPFPELLTTLTTGAGSPGIQRDALAFRLEQCAWQLIEEGTHELFMNRLGPARNEKDVFDLLQKAGRLDLAFARRLKQWTEYRLLASRDPSKIDWTALLSALPEDEQVLRTWRARTP